MTWIWCSLATLLGAALALEVASLIGGKGPELLLAAMLGGFAGVILWAILHAQSVRPGG